MRFRSRIGFGAGPVSGLMTGADILLQERTLAAAVEGGVDWIDTAAGYGGGQSESSLGHCLSTLGFRGRVQIATKVRLMPDQLPRPFAAVRHSVESSLQRLGIPSCDLLYLHNAVTQETGEQPASLALHEVLRTEGVLAAMEKVREEGLTHALAITATGDAECDREIILSGRIQAMQIPYNLLNPSAGAKMPAGWQGTNYGDLIGTAVREGVRVFAIRVLAGGALALRPPSAHTLTTPYFPLTLYQEDRERALHLRSILPDGMDLPEAAVRFALSHPGIDCVLLGMGTPQEVEQALHYQSLGPLPADLLRALTTRSLEKRP
ncbi:MAG: aldo/keto reductase [Syntrophaceae bacterium]|nr:aldo/keto reductase [Syntrophaceae bacterium]